VDGDSGERQTRVERQNRLRIREDAKPINIRFNADVNAAMPISFVPRQATVQVLPGEAALAFYTAQNRANEDIVGIATYNVVPAKAGIYFNKIQCFCFEEQRFKAGERIDMPVLFFIDREFYDDPRMVDVDTIILSYTFFRAQDVSPEFLAEQQRKALGLAMD
jgi:cytochrome c oxidase assembly protein subunit 11